MGDNETSGAARRPRLPEPGWMPDPARLDIERYWDGTRWTARTRDRATKVEIQAAPARASRRQRARREGRTGGAARWLAGLAVVAAVVFGAGYMGYLPEWTGWDDAWSGGVAAAPEVDYPVFGSNEDVTYVAAHMIAQHQEIDVSRIAGLTGTDFSAVEDVMREALVQNPYVFVSSWQVTTRAGRTTLLPDYVYSETEAERRRLATAEAVAAIVADPSVAAAATQADLVTALHDAVLRATTYDYAAFDRIVGGAGVGEPDVARSQEAYGSLVEGTAVCTGYAQALLVLAEAAGLDAVVVTGEARSGFTTGPHAWNLVKVDGRWVVVDATWDDADDTVAGRDFLMLDMSDSALATRTTDADWVVEGNAPF